MGKYPNTKSWKEDTSHKPGQGDFFFFLFHIIFIFQLNKLNFVFDVWIGFVYVLMVRVWIVSLCLFVCFIC